MDALVAEKVILKKADDLGVTFDDDEINDKADEKVKMYKESSKTDEEFNEFIGKYGYDEESFKEYWVRQTKIEQVVEKMLEDVEASDEECQKYYDDNIDQYKVNPGAEVKHILFTDATEGEAQAKAARELAVSGKTFDEIAAMDEYKDKCQSEDLGHQDFENTQMVEEFVNAFKGLPENEISQPVKTQFGWHLILNTKINKEEVTKTYDEVKEQVKTTVLNTKKGDKYKELIEQYKEDIGVKIYEDRI